MAEEDVIDRDAPDETPGHEALVVSLSSKIQAAKIYHAVAFKRMNEDERRAWGQQWSVDHEDDRYVANVILRHVQQKTSMIAAKNPRVIARKRERIEHTAWDGTQTALATIHQGLQQMQMAAAQGMVDPQMMMDFLSQSMPIVADAQEVQERTRQLDLISKTLELLVAHDLHEQVHDFKTRLRTFVRTAITHGAAYIKLGFQRAMEMDVDLEARISDATEELKKIEQLAADQADGIFDEDDERAEQLRLMIENMRTKVEVIVREGLTFDFPRTQSIIVDPKCMNLKEFIGAAWVCQEHLLTVDEIKQIYGVDVGSAYKAYQPQSFGAWSFEPTLDQALEEKVNASHQPKYAGDQVKNGHALVWEFYNKEDGMVYHICEGYPSFLRTPAAPETKLERFFPWFPLVFNEVPHGREIFPPSDVHLLWDAQQEINRARQGLREHRRAARPKTIVSAGMLSESDKHKLENHPDNAVIELAALLPQQRVDDLLQAFNGPQINPVMYEVNPSFQDILRVGGMQEANLGGTGGGTATESQIAQSSLSTSIGASIDEFDDLLTILFREGGQILLREVSPETAKKIVGPGAVWPELTNEEIIQEIYLEVEAGSTGRPNQAAEIQNFERLAPLLMQMPGINPEWLIKEGIKRLDDNIDLTNAYMPNMPSITAMNGMGSPEGAEGAGQGAQGAANGQQPDRPQATQGAPDQAQVSNQLPN